MAVGALIFFFIDAHKKQLALKRKLSTPPNSPGQEPEVVGTGTVEYFNSLSRNHHNDDARMRSRALIRTNYDLLRPNITAVNVHTAPNQFRSNSIFSSTLGAGLNPELTMISEEVIMDNYLDDCFIDDSCITTCNQEEKYLMLSEFENNFDTRLLPEEARRLIRARKQFGAKNCDHVEGCPAKLQNEPQLRSDEDIDGHLAPKRRRASFAGISSLSSSQITDDDSGIKLKSITSSVTSPALSKLPLTECPSSSSSKVVEQCPCCQRYVECEISIENEEMNEEIDDKLVDDAIDEIDAKIASSVKFIRLSTADEHDGNVDDAQDNKQVACHDNV